MNNLNIQLYDSIFKRKSFYLFRNIGNKHITENKIKDIENVDDEKNLVAEYKMV